MTVRLAPCALALLLCCLGWAAQAQYKVIDAQGGVTYTDRPVAPPGGRVLAIGRDDAGTAAAAPGAPTAAALPLALRQAVARFPVTLYTAADCGPCASGRTLLQQRGVPFIERVVAGNDAIEALQRLTAGRSVPSLAVGGQVLRGYQQADWLAMLDLAGYPRESQLPRSYSQPQALPLVAGSQVDGGETGATPRGNAVDSSPALRDLSPAVPVAPATPGAIRF